MAVILQEVVGQTHDKRFYPTLSGVARSVNYYPIGDELAEEGTVNLALGLGKYIVDGGQCLRVCPAHPHQVLQTSEMELALRETQTRFYALDLQNPPTDFQKDDGFNLLKLRVNAAEPDGTLQYIASTYDPYDQVIRDGIYEGGRKVITFCGVLQQNVFPLPDILQKIMRYGQDEMRRAVEIEFAANVNADRTGLEWSIPVVMAEGERSTNGFNPKHYEASTIDRVDVNGHYFWVIQYSYRSDWASDDYEKDVDGEQRWWPLAYVYSDPDMSIDELKDFTGWHWGGIIGDNGGFFRKDVGSNTVTEHDDPTTCWATTTAAWCTSTVSGTSPTTAIPPPPRAVRAS